ncbi:hypothetical protein CHLNCDRAFT_135199 [Chlorella variabilis]|uniref:Uncharacterized protein n=1 Tax=Chlorella variabilis TaxID=554065 RepID=E1ZHP9_CHLVA|nr:hypothetical protein CHLNCDRAFT_135199 [Chlorella variabilis]EFN54643.1 hypothetical protein CHLNCDRAFT_135199 [Chlorella variabilis]|eukprot:XP_005846745.1 hypothetical protein CHLNCDRAFT_135199 [Chlorella variabilis]
MCCPVVVRASPKDDEKTVTAEDVQQVHAALERCIQRGLNKLEAVQLLARLGVAPKFSLLVWDRLEAENKEFFAAYNTQLAATAELERCHL